ncbi:hypothetical protein SAMN02949497_2527 [Methylomagnum ishizawai]|uniref:DOMON-like domain-containing protein n=1 Tax=Methylomagnum ishizawai TaxID=1760988 RepID=A0A1Y6CY65_9GAMM|nr:DOMON-like domain-containing protein [Methylomagnum ishizawai]SMF95180.1 hypothetical protein SAMN02949497_2527 [Methylomagnum ishizawai]
MSVIVLQPHPATPCAAIHRFQVRAGLDPSGRLALGYAVEGDIDGLLIPAPAAPGRADGLWRQTCCEAFLARPGLPGYLEFNFSPCGAWAAYRFRAYRAGMAVAEPAQPPLVQVHRTPYRLALSATVELRGLVPEPAGTGYRMALSAVVEDRDGGLSYWALAHPPGRPDFHHDHGFALVLSPSHP